MVIALIMSLVAAFDPEQIKNLVFKSENGAELTLERNVDTPERIKAATEADKEIDKGTLTAETEELVQVTETTEDARRSASDYLVLATENWKAGDLLEGLAYAQQGLRLEPQDKRLKASLFSRMGVLLVFIGNTKEAEEYYRKAIATDSTFSWPHSNLGSLLDDLKRYEESEASYRKAIDIDPEYAAAHYNLGNLLKKLKRYKESEASYRKAIDLDPEYASAHYNLGNLLDDLKRYEESEASYRKAIDIDPEHASAHYNLGVLFYEQERYDEAETAYRKALSIDPDNAHAQNNLKFLLRAMEKESAAQE